MSTPYSQTIGSATAPFSTAPSFDSAAVFEALADDDCRQILETATESMTARELVGACDIPSSTLYRKLEIVTEAGLLEERVRIARDGKHASEYRRRFEDLSVSLEGGIDVAATSAETERPPTVAAMHR